MLGGPISESGLAISNNVSVDNNIQTPDYDSFCVKYSDDDRERDNHEYDGHCQVYFNDVISVSGAVVGIEYLGENSVKYNINSKDFKSIDSFAM